LSGAGRQACPDERDYICFIPYRKYALLPGRAPGAGRKMTQVPTRAEQTPSHSGETGGKRRIPHWAAFAGILRALAPALAPTSALETERRQTRERLAGSILVLAYLGVRHFVAEPIPGYPVWLAVFFAFIVAALAAFWRAHRAAAPSSTRRLI